MKLSWANVHFDCTHCQQKWETGCIILGFVQIYFYIVKFRGLFSLNLHQVLSCRVSHFCNEK